MQSIAITCSTPQAQSATPVTIKDIAARVTGVKSALTSAAPSPLPRLYVRPDEAAEMIGVSRRTLSAWQSARVLSFRRVGRTVLFSVADIQRQLDKFTIAAVGESAISNPRKRRAGRITTLPPKE